MKHPPKHQLLSLSGPLLEWWWSCWGSSSSRQARHTWRRDIHHRQMAGVEVSLWLKHKQCQVRSSCISWLVKSIPQAGTNDSHGITQAGYRQRALVPSSKQ